VKICALFFQFAGIASPDLLTFAINKFCHNKCFTQFAKVTYATMKQARDSFNAISIAKPFCWSGFLNSFEERQILFFHFFFHVCGVRNIYHFQK